ncbi:MAG: hypothetical protein IJ774_11440, partial [Selenomonadaceae bacterium]|nr:hypothetical protein [Selenomonadaceae bacterium]
MDVGQLQWVIRNDNVQQRDNTVAHGCATARSFSRDAKIPGQTPFSFGYFSFGRSKRKVTF